MDEIIAMKEAGLTEAQMLDRLGATNQLFDFAPEQVSYLLEHGVSQSLIDQARQIGQTTSAR